MIQVFYKLYCPGIKKNSKYFIFVSFFSGGNDYYRELNEQDYDMMLDDTPRGKEYIFFSID